MSKSRQATDPFWLAVTGEIALIDRLDIPERPQQSGKVRTEPVVLPGQHQLGHHHRTAQRGMEGRVVRRRRHARTASGLIGQEGRGLGMRRDHGMEGRGGAGSKGRVPMSRRGGEDEARFSAILVVSVSR